MIGTDCQRSIAAPKTFRNFRVWTNTRNAIAFRDNWRCTSTACSVRETSPFGAQLAAAFTPKLCHYGGFQASLACNDSLAPSLVIQGVGSAVLSVLNDDYTSWCLYSTTPVLKGICTRQRLYLRQGTAFLVPYVISRNICRNPAWQMCFNPCTFILIVISICRILWS